MSEHETPASDPVADASALGLAVVGGATAVHTGDTDAVVAAEDNLRDAVDELVDEPLTDRQQEVVEALASASSGLTAGLAGEVAVDQDRPVSSVLQGAARSILMQQRLDDQKRSGEA
jgi:hypothetical protein